jgi:aldose sugar dehydrogenase
MIWPTSVPLHYRYFLFFYFICILVLVSYDNSVFAAPTIKDTNLKVSTVATGLSSPTSMAFLGPNDILVLEKNTGLVKRIKDGVLLPGSLLDLSVATNSERGLLGIGVTNVGTSTTQFYVFLYYTAASSDGGTASSNRLSKYTLVIDPTQGGSQGHMTLSGVLLNLPVTPGPNHDGGKVAIGPDSNVYIVIGDVNRKTQAQNFESGPTPDGTGGILRVTQDGKTVGSGILGTSDPLNKYFAYGVRNAFGLDFDPVTKKLWDTENGPSSNDEINVADPGFNSGWMDLMGIAPSGFNFNNLVNFGGKGIYSDPEFVWTQVVAPTALKFFSSSKLGSNYQNDLFVADFIKGRIYDFDLNSARTGLALSGSLADKIANTDTEAQQAIFGEGFGGISDLKVGPTDGYLYVLSISNGAIYKVTGPTDSTPPTVVSTKPADAATGVEVSSLVTADFSEAVQNPTVTTSTFSLKTNNINVPGSVALSQDGKKATFSPSSSLVASTPYTATITTGVKDLAGNGLASNKVWSFTTAASTPTSCNSNLVIGGGITSSGNQNTFPPTNAIDNNFNTKWFSTFIANPWINLDLGSQKSICSVDIAWADGNTRQYSFVISVSTDGSTFANVFSGKSKGSTTSPEKYSFTESQARFVKITVTQSHAGSSRSIAQISEIDAFGKATSSSSSFVEPSASQRLSQADVTQSSNMTGTGTSSLLLSSASGTITNRSPIAKDDRLNAEKNTPIVATILENDMDPDEDNLRIVSVSTPTSKGGSAIINYNGTLTYIPPDDFVGSDSFTYVISDGQKENDEAKVRIVIRDVNRQNLETPTISTPSVNDKKETLDSSKNLGPLREDELTQTRNLESIPPKADAGHDLIAREETEVVLDGSSSFDKDGGIISYKWEQITGPKVMLRHADEIKSSFLAPSVFENSLLGFKLTVSDNSGSESLDRVNVMVLNATSEQ